MKIKSLNIPCKSYVSGTPIDGYEYECEYYDKSGLCMDNYFKLNPYKFINDYIDNLKWYQKSWLKLCCKRKDKQIKILSVDLASDSELHFNIERELNRLYKERR